ncbi:hypothetical protein GJ744_010754 [Endocarpon pusillum]|uniref:Uncharacterized protein n=1 Tax=Endocarpon pusillum TaxID=364733 RepID=A0A8H7ALJ6_9EURO|nr:hypothetical protein GJ744_010754 [Endocarpon pusillum]
MAQPNTHTQEYFLPGFGLSRQIVIGHIQYFLGPSARVRPYRYQQRDGYLVVGPQLTRRQIEDLQNLSQEYERQETLRMSRSSSSDQRDPYINQLIPDVGRTSSSYGSSRNSR